MLCVHFELTLCWVVTIKTHIHTHSRAFIHVHAGTDRNRNRQIVVVMFSGVGRRRPRLGKQVLSVRPAVEMTDK